MDPTCRRVSRPFRHRRRALPAVLAVLALAAGGCAPLPHAPDRRAAEPAASGAGLMVLVSNDEPVFQAVARELVRQAGPGVQSLRLGDGSAAGALRRLNDPAIETVVAVGLPAAQLARRASGKRVVFCQVFNYEEAALVSPTVKGVSALPPLEVPFRLWKEMDPRLGRIGVITGAGLGPLVREARSAARSSGIEIEHVEVRSDKETLYAFRRLLPRIQGLWLVPDNRVLSATVIRDLLALAVREGRPVLGFRHELLALGALLSAESDPADVAARALARARARPEGAALAGPAVTGLTRADVRINRVVAQSLGLNLPAGEAWRARAL